MTLKQVIESLSSLRSSQRVEDLISKSGVQFQATPGVADLLKQFGASARLISMIPPPPTPPPAPAPAAPKLAGPLSIVCEPNDCVVLVDNKHEGLTDHNRKTIAGLTAGEANVEVFADGYEHLARKVRLEADKPAEEKFTLKRSMPERQQIASTALLKAVTTLGGAEGFAEFADVEGNGTMQWMNSKGGIEHWEMTFNKRIGRDLVVTFKTDEGQCTATIQGQTTRQECRGGLKNNGEKIADQGSTIFLSYQLQDVIQTLLKRPLLASETDDNRIESNDTKDSYFFTINDDGLPINLVYQIGEKEAPIQVQYSNYLSLNKGRVPGKISLGRMNNDPTWVFTLSSVHSKALRNQPATPARR
jgi:hypothetical protein